MLHITSFMQNITKLNNNNNKSSAPINENSTANGLASSLNTRLNGFNRNYSFVYDHNLKRYDYQYNHDDDEDDDETLEGFWGYLRDKNADRKLNNTRNAASNTKKETTKDNKETDIWGIFRDDGDGVDDLPGKGYSESSSLSASFSLSSSINSLSRFKEPAAAATTASLDIDYSESEISRSLSKLSSSFRDFDYKTTKFKIQARKRDEKKILIQSLEDKELLFTKETIKSFEPTKCLLNSNEMKSSSLSSSLNSNIIYSKKIKEINFLHFSTCQHVTSKSFSLNKFKNVFNTISKLNKSINVFNGDILNNINHKTDIPLLNNVHASILDVNGFLRSYFNQMNACAAGASGQQSSALTELKTTAVSLCSNLFENTSTPSNDSSSYQKLFGEGNHSTMMFEYQNIKIGFMALVDNLVYDKLNKAIKQEISHKNDAEAIVFGNEDDDDNNNNYETNGSSVLNQIEYADYVQEADRLSKQLRLCGANVIVCLINMESEQNEQRLLREATDLDIIFGGYFTNNGATVASSTPIDLKKNCFNNRYLIKTESNFDCVSLVTLRLDEFDSNKMVDIAINKYVVD